MSDDAHDMLVRGIASAKSGEKDLARRYLLRSLELKPSAEQREKAWYWLGDVGETLEERRGYLTTFLSARPNDLQARRKLAILDGRLRPEVVIDPDHLPTAQARDVVRGDARRFICPQCGGRLTFTPDGGALTCESCEVQQGIAARQWQLVGEDGSELDDFAIAMSTIKGHSRPQVEAQQVECNACGAPLEVAPGRLSGVCPHCRSIFVMELVEGELHFNIQALIPFSIDEAQAQAILRQTLIGRRLGSRTRYDDLEGFYLPAWFFSLSGASTNSDLLIPASRILPADFLSSAVDDFDLSALVSFTPAYLANWNAEIYQVSLAEASLAARFKALKKVEQEHRDIWELLVEGERPRISSMDLLIDQFDLVLLPFWRWGYSSGREQHILLVNGQNGAFYETLEVRKSGLD